MSQQEITSNQQEDQVLEKLFEHYPLHLTQSQQPLRSTLERLRSRYDHFKIAFYQVLLQLRASFTEKDPQQKALLLAEALKHMESLTAKDSPIAEDELLTLKAYYYYALIATSPAEYGPIHYRDVMTYCQRAIAHNKENPRPQLIQTVFGNKMAASRGKHEQDTEYCVALKSLEQALRDYAIKRPKGAISWGMMEVMNYWKMDCR